MTETTIGIIFALDLEFEEYSKKVSFNETFEYIGYKFYKAEYKNCNVVCVSCGIGKVNAGAVTTLLVEHFNPTYIINSGIAGSIDRTLHTLDTVICTKGVYLDVDLTSDEYTDFPYGQLQGFPRVFTLDKDICECLYKLLPNCKFKTIGTSDKFIADYRMIKSHIDDHFGDLDISLCDMESTAVYQIGFIHKIPVIIVRSVSDVVGHSGDYSNFAQGAAEASASTILTIIENINKLPIINF